MVEIFLAFIISFFGTFYVLPHSIRKLELHGFLAKDMYKKDKPLIPTNAGIILLFTSYISIALLPFLTRLINLINHSDLSQNFIDSHLGLILVVSIYAMYGIVDDLVDTSRIMKFYLPIAFSFPLMSVIHPSFIWLPIIGNIDLSTQMISVISYSDFVRFVIVPIYVMVVANLINMHSGYNGLQSGLSVILITTLILKSMIDNNEEAIIPVGAFLGSLVAFSYFNYYPSRVFEGNIGSMIFGSLIGSIIVIQELWWFGFFILVPHTFNFLLWILWLFMIKKNPKDYLEADGKHRKFGYVRDNGTLNVPNKLTLKWIPNYYFDLTESQSTLISYCLTITFCIVGLFLI